MSQDKVPDSDEKNEYTTPGPHDSFATFSTDSIVVTDEGSGSGDEAENTKPQERDGIVWYRKRGFWVICSIFTLISNGILLLLLFLVIFPAVAQRSINNSVLTFDEINITAPITEEGFYLTQHGSVSNAGAFSAKVSFPDPVKVSWNGIELGSMQVNDLHTKGGKGEVNNAGPFTITNDTAFGEFTKVQLNGQNFTWTLSSKVDVKAMGVVKHGLNFHKDILILGSDGYENVNVTKFAISTNPANASTLALNLTTEFNNPSPIAIDIGTLVLNIFYNDRFIGPVTGTNLTIKSGYNSVDLNGFVTDKSDPLDTAAVSEFFQQYINGESVTTVAHGVSAKPDGVTEIEWLTAGVQNLTLKSVLKGNKTNLFTQASLGALDLQFSSGNPYAPVTSSTNTTVGYKLPFDISFSVNSVKEDIKLVYKNVPIAGLTSDWINATNDAEYITLAIPPTPLQAVQGNEEQFAAFIVDLTLSDSVIVNLNGTAGVQANTAVGPIKIDVIPMDVPTTITGFSGLNKTNTTITNLNVVGGEADGFILTLQALLDNPSQVSLGLGDTNLAIKYQGVQVGIVIVKNLTLIPGPNTLNVTAIFDPSSTDQGKEVMALFLNQTGADVTLSGYDGCTNVTSVVPALKALNIPSTFPGLTQKLLAGGSLQVLNTTTSDSIASSTVTIDNTFLAPLLIKKIDASITVQGINLGVISVDAGNTPITIAAQQNATTPPLPVKLNLDPVQIFTLLRVSAVKQGKDVRPLDALLTIGGIDVPGVDHSIKPDPSLFNDFDLKSFVLDTLKIIPVDVVLKSVVQLGQFVTELDYSQSEVLIQTDDSLAILVPFLGQPIVQDLVSGAKLEFENILLKDLSDTQFDADIGGFIQNTGPIPATIAFPIGVTVLSNKQVLGTLDMPNVQAKNGFATLNLTSSFKVENIDALEAFSEQLLGTDAASWDISAQGMVVTALGFDFPNISLSQTVDLKGSKGFKGDVVILDFEMPGVAPEGGIALQIKTSLKNEGTVGVDPGILLFNAVYKGVVVGPVQSDGDIVQPASDNILNLKGRITPKQDPNENAVIEDLFNAFIHGEKIELTTVGQGVIPKSGSCKWLSEAVKKLSIDIDLPTPQNLTLIPSVDLKTLDLTFTPDTAYAPDSSSDSVVAGFNNPFGFPLDIQQIEESIVVRNNNADMARLVIPKTPAITDGKAKTVTTSFKDIPFKINDGQNGNFDGFVKDLTLSKSKTFELVGLVNAVTNTPSGTFTISNITFDVQTTLPGLQGLQSAPIIVDNVVVKGGEVDVLDISVDVTLTNPSNIQITVGDVSFNAIYQGAFLGQTLLKDLVLKPGVNTIPAAFEYAPKGEDLAGAGAALLGNFLENKDSELSIQGTENSTQVSSLQPAFASLKLDSTLKGINGTLIQSANVTVNITSLQATTIVVIHNPLDIDIGITAFLANVFLAGTKNQVGIIGVKSAFPLPVPAKGVFTGPPLPLNFTTDPRKLLPIITAHGGKLPVDMVINATTILGKYTAVIAYEQDNVLVPVQFAKAASSATNERRSKGIGGGNEGKTPTQRRSKGIGGGNEGKTPTQRRSKGIPPERRSKGLPPERRSKGIGGGGKTLQTK